MRSRLGFSSPREGDEEKTAAKKSPPCEVLICGSIPRFSNRRRFRQSSRGLTVRGWHRPRFSLFLLLLPSL
ncbi:hypothetical protein B296_00038819 [Ensete ventricosum]|uniref:Uncharacterized protein n=1 Tax=Ensete ventricosum TaxID=4639 RepID=A0A426ZDH3_ENSVE|nr:hypothetical protein B296_00038819 [Ensete ventricosum]